MLFASCSKDDVLGDELIVEGETSVVTLSNELGFENQNGILKVKDFETFMEALSYFSDSEDRLVTNETLDRWENSLGFESLRSQTNRIYDQYQNIETLDQAEAFKSLNSEYIDQNEDFVFPSTGMVLGTILSGDGMIYIGNSLHCFVDKYQIMVADGDREKMKIALETMKDNSDLGITIGVFSPEDDLKKSCGHTRKCTDVAGNKKVEGEWRLLYFAQPVSDGYKVGVGYRCTMKSRKKVLWWWGDNHKDDIYWKTWYSVYWNIWENNGPSSNGWGDYIQHGTGWTQNSAEIEYVKSLSNVIFVQGNYPSVSLNFGYNITEITNKDVSGLSCSDDCP